MNMNETGGLITSIIGLGLIGAVAGKTIDMVNQNTKTTKKRSKKDIDLMSGYSFENPFGTKQKRKKSSNYDDIFGGWGY